MLSDDEFEQFAEVWPSVLQMLSEVVEEAAIRRESAHTTASKSRAPVRVTRLGTQILNDQGLVIADCVDHMMAQLIVVVLNEHLQRTDKPNPVRDVPDAFDHSLY